MNASRCATAQRCCSAPAAVAAASRALRACVRVCGRFAPVRAAVARAHVRPRCVRVCVQGTYARVCAAAVPCSCACAAAAAAAPAPRALRVCVCVSVFILWGYYNTHSSSYTSTAKHRDAAQQHCTQQRACRLALPHSAARVRGHVKRAPRGGLLGRLLGRAAARVRTAGVPTAVHHRECDESGRRALRMRRSRVHRCEPTTRNRCRRIKPDIIPTSLAPRSVLRHVSRSDPPE